MEKSTVLAALTFVTLLSGMAVAAYQLWVTEEAKKKGTGGPLLNRPSGTTAGKEIAGAVGQPKSTPTSGATTENQPT